MVELVFTDLMINTHDDTGDIYSSEQDCSTLILEHFQQVSSTRIERNEAIYEHIDHLIRGEPSDNLKFILENPFPDNDCELAMIKALKKDGLLLKFVSERLRKDEHIVLTAVKECNNAIEFANPEFRKSREFLEKIIKNVENNPSLLKSGSFFEHFEKFHDDEEIVKKIVKKFPSSLEFVSNRLKNDREICVQSVKRRGFSIRFVPEHLRDKEMMLLSATTCPIALQYAPKEFLIDKEIVEEFVKINALAMRFVPEELKNDREFALKMVKLNPNCYDKISDKLKGDREIALEYIRLSNASKFENAPYNIRDDEEIVTLAVKKRLKNISHASQRFKDNLDFIYECASSADQVVSYLNSEDCSPDYQFLKRLIEKFSRYSKELGDCEIDDQIMPKLIEVDPDCLLQVNSEDILNDRQLLFDLLPHSEEILDLIPENLINDRELILKAVKIHEYGLYIASKELCSDRDIAIQALICDPRTSYFFLSDELKSDRNIVEETMYRDGRILQDVSESFRNDRELLLTAIRHSFIDIASYIGYEHIDDRELILESVKMTGSIENVLYQFKEDREIVQIAIQQDGAQYQFASNSMRSERELAIIAIRNSCSLEHVLLDKLDRELVYEACKRSSDNLEFASEYRDDEQIVMTAACSNTGTTFFEHISERLRNNRDFVLQLVKVNAGIVQYVSAELKDDREIIMNAVTSDGELLKYASKDFQNDREIVEKAIMSKPDALRFSYYFRNNLELYTKAISFGLTKSLYSIEKIEKVDERIIGKCIEDGSSLEYASESVKRNRQIVIKSINNDMTNILFVPHELIDKELIMEISPSKFDILLLPLKWRSDRDIALKALETNGKSIIYLSEEFKNEFRNNKELILKALKTDPIPFIYASEELQHDREFVLESVATNGMVLKLVPLQFQLDREVVLTAVKNNGISIQFGVACFIKDREIMWNAVQNLRPSESKVRIPLIFASFELRSDRELVLEAIRHDYNALEYATYELKSDEEFIANCVEINILCLKFANYQLRFNLDFLKRLNKIESIRAEENELHDKIDFEGLLGYNPKMKNLTW